MVPPLVPPHHSRPPCVWTLVIDTPPLRLWPPPAPAHCDREKLVGSKGEGAGGIKAEEGGKEGREIGGEMGGRGRKEGRGER